MPIPEGRLPDDTWILRPQDLPGRFQRGFRHLVLPARRRHLQRTGRLPRLPNARTTFGRIIRASSNEGDLVLDPFTGSGTTLTVAKKLGRQWLGFELSPDYVRQATQRIENAAVGSDLNGAADPLASAQPRPTEKGASLAQQNLSEKKRSMLNKHLFEAHHDSVSARSCNSVFNCYIALKCVGAGRKATRFPADNRELRCNTGTAPPL